MNGFSKASEILDKIGLPKIAEGSEIEQKSQPVVAEAPSRPRPKIITFKVSRKIAESTMPLLQSSGQKVWRNLMRVETEEEQMKYLEAEHQRGAKPTIQGLYKWVYEEGKKHSAYYLPEEIVREKPNWALVAKACLGSIEIAFEQKSPVIRFTPTEKLRKLGYSEDALQRSGTVYSQLATAEKTLAAMLIHYDNGETGAKRIEFFGHFYSYLLKCGNNYEVGLNPKLVEGIDFQTGMVQAPYVQLLSIAHGNRFWRYERNLRMKLFTFRGYSELKFTGENLLTWAGVPKNKWRYKAIQTEIYKIAKQILEVELGFQPREGMVEIKALRKFRKLKFHYREKERRTFTSGELKLAQKIAKWLCAEGQESADIEPKIKRCIATYGASAIERCFEGAGSARDFWRQIGELKWLRQFKKEWKKKVS